MFRTVFVFLLAWAASAQAVDDPAFQLLEEAEKVKIYSRKPGHCTSSGADVLFVVENKTRERLELKMELLDLKVRNRLTVLLEPSGSTSVLSFLPDAEVCGLKLVGLQVNPAAAKAVPAKVDALPAIAGEAGGESPKPAPEPHPAGGT